MKATDNLDIKTDRISEGQVIKNYKTLCAELQLPENLQTVKGTQRKAVFKEIDRYIHYERDGNAFIIKEIYDHPLLKDDKRLQGKYVQYIELILCKFLAINSPKEYELSDVFSYNLTSVNWFKLFGLCNEKYKDKRYYNDLLAIQTLDENAIHEFYFREDDRLKSVLFSTLNSLKNQKLIKYSERKIIVDENGEHNLATPEEEDGIFIAERDTLLQMNLSNMYQMRIRKLSDKYYYNVKCNLKKDTEKWKDIENEDYVRRYKGDFSNLDYYYKVIEIRYSPAKIIEHLQLMLGEDSEEQRLLEAIRQNNIGIIDNLHKQIEADKKKYVIMSPEMEAKWQQEELLISKLIEMEESEINKSYRNKLR